MEEIRQGRALAVDNKAKSACPTESAFRCPPGRCVCPIMASSFLMTLPSTDSHLAKSRTGKRSLVR